MIDLFDKYKITLDDLKAYAENKLTESKANNVQNAINKEEIIKNLYDGFLLIKEDNPNKTLAEDSAETWELFMGNSIDENDTKAKPIIKLRKWGFAAAAVIIVIIASTLILNMILVKNPAEIAQSIVNNTTIQPENVRGELMEDDWKKSFIAKDYNKLLNNSNLANTEQEELLFFAGLSCLLKNDSNPKQAITYFERTQHNNSIFYDNDALFYEAIAYILEGDNKKAESLLLKCKNENNETEISQLLEALRR